MNKRSAPSHGLYWMMPVILLFWGSFAAFSKLALQGMDNFQLQFYMFGSATLINTAWLLARRKFTCVLSLSRREFLIVTLCALPYYLYYFLYTFALRLIPAVEASMLNYLFPVMIVLFSAPINREKLTPPKIISIAVGFIGTAVILTKGDLRNLSLTNAAGDALAIGAAACWGIYSNLGKWNRSDTVASGYLCVLESFVFSCVSLACFSRFAVPGPLSLLAALELSLSNVVLAVPLWIRVLKTVPSSVAAAVSFLAPFVTLVFIMLLTGERIAPAQSAGLIVIVAAIALQYIRPRQERRKLTDRP